MKGKFALFVDDCVASIAAALIADYHIVILGEQVDHTAFSLVTPVDPYYCTI